MAGGFEPHLSFKKYNMVREKPPSAIRKVDWVSHCYIACVTNGSFEMVDTGKDFGGETTNVNKSLSPPHDFIEKKIVFTKVRIYLYIVL